MTHRPTGISVRIENERSQHANRRTARAILEARVKAHYSNIQRSKQAQQVREQIGSGQRGDKIKTYRVRDDLVIDHVTGRKHSLTQIRKGIL